MNRRSFQQGFTITEVLVVLVIVAGLAAIAYPIGRVMTARSKSAACLSNLRQIGIGLEAYLQDNAQTFPDIAAGRRSRGEDVPVLETVLERYLPGENVFRCPADPDIFEKSGSSYGWNSTQSGRHRMQLSFFGKSGDDRRIPLVTDKESWHPGDPGANILYADFSASSELKFSVSP